MPIVSMINKMSCYTQLALILLLAQFVSSLSDVYKSYENYKSYRVLGTRAGIERAIAALLEADDSLVYSYSRDETEVIIAPAFETLYNEIVGKENLTSIILFDDVSKIIQLEKTSFLRSKDFSWTAYYDIDDIYSYLKKMKKIYPSWTELIVGGQSYQSRSILGLRINTPSANNSSKPVVFIESGIHAREWIGPAATTYFINQLLTSADPNITALRDQFDWRIFPSVNPDGYHYSFTVDRMWRKNVSPSSSRCIGSDPNRNWDYNWGQYSSSSDPCDETYAGTKPFSETETRSLSSYIRRIDNLLAYISFHSFAGMLLIPLSDSTQHVDNYDDLVKIGKTSLEYGYEVHKKHYTGPGTAAEILYKASGGSMDWVKYVLKTPLVYTYELRGNSFHWPPSRISEQGDEVTQMILGLATEARRLGYY